MKITASIVTYKTDTVELGKVLRCLVEACVEVVYVVDNSPNDELRGFVGAFGGSAVGKGVEYIFGQGNVGYGAAHNIAIRRAMECGALYHAVVNPDVYFDGGTIETLAAYMDANSDVGQVMPRIVYPNGELQYVCKMVPTPSDLIFKRFLPGSMTAKSMNRFQLKFTGYDSPMNVPYLSGCFMFFRVSALERVGLFDERFFMYPEDIDITRRVHARFRTMFFPDVTVVHAHAAQSKTSKKMLWIHITNMIKYFNKWGWVFDRERRSINKKILKELHYNE